MNENKMSELFPEQDASTASSDLCRRGQPMSAFRVLVMTLCFIVMLGSLAFLFPKSGSLYRVQIVSIFSDTAAVILYTFSANKNGMRPFMFSCPIVRRTMPRLFRRNVGFLATLIILETAAFGIRPHLPTGLTTAAEGNWSPFTISLAILCACVALTQILTNRSLLDSAHESVEDETTG